MVRSAEEFCRQYGGLHQIAVKILRVLYLYSGTYEEDYFFKLFSTVIVQLAKNTSMNGHIAKPLDMNKLNDVLGNWL